MRTLTIAAIVCLLLAGSARAALIDYTGESYSWVAYDNLTATLGQTVPANINTFSFDGDRRTIHVPSGVLVDNTAGASTGVTMDVAFPNDGVVGQLFSASNSGGSTHVIFDDVLGASYWGTTVLHNNPSPPTPANAASQLITFTGLDPSKTYTFAGVSTSDSGHSAGGLSSVEIQGADSQTNDSLLTTQSPLPDYPGFGKTPTSTFLSYVDDDLVLWTSIDPGLDGTFSILVTHLAQSSQGWAPGLDAIALAEVIPEPATAVVLMVGAAAVLTRRSSRRA